MSALTSCVINSCNMQCNGSMSSHKLNENVKLDLNFNDEIKRLTVHSGSTTATNTIKTTDTINGDNQLDELNCDYDELENFYSISRRQQQQDINYVASKWQKIPIKDRASQVLELTKQYFYNNQHSTRDIESLESSDNELANHHEVHDLQNVDYVKINPKIQDDLERCTNSENYVKPSELNHATLKGDDFAIANNNHSNRELTAQSVDKIDVFSDKKIDHQFTFPISIPNPKGINFKSKQAHRLDVESEDKTSNCVTSNLSNKSNCGSANGLINCNWLQVAETSDNAILAASSNVTNPLEQSRHNSRRFELGLSCMGAKDYCCLYTSHCCSACKIELDNTGTSCFHQSSFTSYERFSTNFNSLNRRSCKLIENEQERQNQLANYEIITRQMGNSIENKLQCCHKHYKATPNRNQCICINHYNNSNNDACNNSNNKTNVACNQEDNLHQINTSSSSSASFARCDNNSNCSNTSTGTNEHQQATSLEDCLHTTTTSRQCFYKTPLNSYDNHINNNNNTTDKDCLRFDDKEPANSYYKITRGPQIEFTCQPRGNHQTTTINTLDKIFNQEHELIDCRSKASTKQQQENQVNRIANFELDFQREFSHSSNTSKAPTPAPRSNHTHQTTSSSSNCNQPSIAPDLGLNHQASGSLLHNNSTQSASKLSTTTTTTTTPTIPTRSLEEQLKRLLAYEISGDSQSSSTKLINQGIHNNNNNSDNLDNNYNNINQIETCNMKRGAYDQSGKSNNYDNSKQKISSYGNNSRQTKSSYNSISPDERFAIFMMASKSTHTNSTVERDARILKWLNNCKSAT